ncbi:MAG TPA: hypothetical protein VFQ44_01920 [Streptosporangiaceae bacterium]|nr:hypothetical protein [Streptosporangiaceae bacterium]
MTFLENLAKLGLTPDRVSRTPLLDDDEPAYLGGMPEREERLRSRDDD